MLSVKEIFQKIKEFWHKQSKKSRTVLLCVLAAGVLLTVIVSAVINHVNYAVLYSGLDDSEAGEINAILDEMGADYKVSASGDILVQEDQVASLKMSLASEGYPETALDYDIFSSNAGFMTTDFEKQKYLIFQLQDRLQDSIETIRGVKSAIVTISLPDDDSFVLDEDKTPATASVVLGLEGGISLDSRQIMGIEFLVSKSVPGLTGENVAIIDDLGQILNTHHEDDELAAYDRLELEKSIGSSMEDRITRLLTPVFGAGGFRVAVNVALDTSKKVSEQTTYTPVVEDSGIVSRSEQTRETAGSQTEASGVPGTDTNTGVTTYEEADGAGSTSESESSSTEYLVNQLTEQIQDDGYKVKDLSVAVIIGYPLTEDQVVEYTRMAAYALGVEDDKISISTAQFIEAGETPATGAEETQTLTLTRQQILIAASIGAAVLLIAILLIVLAARRRKKAAGTEEEERPDLEEMLSGTASSASVPGIVLSETREQGLKRQIKDFASGSPEIVAQMIRTWLKEDEEDE